MIRYIASDKWRCRPDLMGDSYREELRKRKASLKTAAIPTAAVIERARAASRSAIRAEHFRKSRARHRYGAQTPVKRLV